MKKIKKLVMEILLHKIHMKDLQHFALFYLAVETLHLLLIVSPKL